MAQAILINAGGGDSNLIGNAVPSDVLEGKTFYSDTDEVLRVGTAKEITGGTTILDNVNTEYTITEESHTSGERIISTNIYNWQMYAWDKYQGGSYIGEVTSMYDNDYPDDGVKDGCYYIRLFTIPKSSISNYSWDELELLGDAIAQSKISPESLNTYYHIAIGDTKEKDGKTYELTSFKTVYDINYNPYGMIFTSSIDTLYKGQSSLPIPRQSLYNYPWQELDLLGMALARGDISIWELRKKYGIKIGDTKTASINNEEHKYRLIGICQDVDLYDDPIGFTFEQVDTLQSDYSFNGSEWSTSELIYILNNTTPIESDLKAYLVVTKKAEGSSNVWIMSQGEFSSYKYYCGKGSLDRIRGANSYWLRSITNGNVDIVQADGTFSTDSSTNSHKVSVCFCIGPKKKPVIMDRIAIEHVAKSLEVQYNG